MPPRRKRSMKQTKTATRKTRSGIVYDPTSSTARVSNIKRNPEDKKEKSNVSTLVSKRIIEPMMTRSHKKFGKFRYLSDELAGDSNTKPEMESSEADTNTSASNDDPKPPNLGSVEISIYPENISSNDSSDTVEKEGNESDLNEADINVIVSGKKHCSIILQDNLNTEMEYTEEIGTVQHEEFEIVGQLSNLNVATSTNEDEESDFNSVITTENETAEFLIADTTKEEIFQVDNLQTDIVFECISEEVIPISEEQEVELSHDNEVEIDEISADDNIIVEQTKDNMFLEQVKDDGVKTAEAMTDNIEGLLQEVFSPKNKPEELALISIVEKEEVKTVIKEENKIATMQIEMRSIETKIKRHSSKAKAEKKSQKVQKPPSTKIVPSENSVRRSSRIKSISVLKQKSKGHGLVKHKKEKEISPKRAETDTSDNSNSGQGDPDKLTASSDSVFLIPMTDTDQKPVKVKSRWRRSSELEMVNSSFSMANRNSPLTSNMTQNIMSNVDTSNIKSSSCKEEVERRLKQFVHLKENQYLTERVSCKEAKKMICDCFLTQEEIDTGEYGCGEDCLNRLLMIECGNPCAVGDRCTNKRFQKGQFAPCEAFQTDKKGLGIRASANIPYGEFILEYVGEVLDPEEFEKRATEYSKDKNQHYYFMSLRADAVIDATQKGNISRFINHSCDPNAETQKWTVNGELRIGFFSKRTILAGEEITFDYQFQRYGKEAQKCYCEASTCRGWLGEEPDDYEDDDEEEDEEEEEEGEEVKEEPAKTEKIEERGVIEPITDTTSSNEGLTEEITVKVEKPVKKERRKIVRPRKPRKDIFEDIDPLEDEIESLQTTGLKNQAHTLKLSRLIVRAKEPPQRTKLLRILRHGELPCRRLFLDYHGLRLIHGWMIDAQLMARIDEKLKSLKLEILQTLATLPIPNKTMLQDSKVLPTVEKWSVGDDCIAGSPADSDSNSPKQETTEPVKAINFKAEDEEINKNLNEIKNTETSNNFQEDMDISPIGSDDKGFVIEVKKMKPPEANPQLPDYDTEIVALAIKLLEEWSVLKEVFRIPKKERIEQMKEHEREADRKYRAGLGSEQERLHDRNSESWHRYSWRHRKKELLKRKSKDRPSNVDKYERRKIFAMQIEFEEAERRRKQQEMWRQHEQRCIVMGTDPRFTAPYDPNQGYQCIWNPQTGQWQNYPLPLNQFPQHTQKLQSNLQTSQQLMLSHLPPPMNTQASSSQNFSANLPNQQFGQHLPSNQHLVGQYVPINQPPPSIPTSQNQPLQYLSTNNQMIAQHLSLNKNILPHPMQSNQHLQPVLQSSHNKNQPNTQMFPNHQLSQHLSLNQQYVSNIPVPPNVTVLPNMNISHNHNIPSSAGLPGSMSLPPNLNLPSNINLNVNLPHNFNVPPNQQLLNHSTQILATSSGHQQQLLTHNSQVLQSSSTHQMQHPSTSQTVQHIGSNNFSFTGNSGLPPLPTNSSVNALPPLPPLPYQDSIKEEEEGLEVRFMGPIPPPVKLPPKWKCAKDKYGRPYYYHIKIRKSQWEPPEFPPEENNDDLSDSSSSSDTSSLSSESSSDDSEDSDDDIDDERLLLEMKNKLKDLDSTKKQIDQNSFVFETQISEEGMGTNIIADDNDASTSEGKEKSLDDRLIEEFCLLRKDESPHLKKRRTGLVQEIPISPRTEEDRLQFKEDVKRYKLNKEKLKKQKELILVQSKKHLGAKLTKQSSKSTKSSKKHKITVKTRLKEIAESNSEAAKKIKETFRSSMAGVMVSILNAYRKPECKEGRITNTEDFKHLARKLTHFVMLKELKHCQNIEDLTCTDSVKSKAKEFVRKYMSKFGENYQRPSDEADF